LTLGNVAALPTALNRIADALERIAGQFENVTS